MRSLRYCLVLMILIGIPARNLAQLPNRVNDGYQADPAGQWQMIANFIDTNGNGFIDTTDTFPSGLAITDPSIAKIGSWWYVTGTDIEHNFRIYRTQDFQTYTPHMYAFDEFNAAVVGGVNQAGQRWSYAPNPTIAQSYMEFFDPTIPNIPGEKFWRMWAPHLYMDPVDANTVYLAFTGVRITDSYVVTSDFDDQYHSCYLVKMAKTDFEAWIGQNYQTFNGRRFNDRRHGDGSPFRYGYLYQNQDKFDGGYGVGRVIASTGDLSDIGLNPGQLYRRYATGQLLGGLGRWNMGRNTVLSIDPFVFFDANVNATPGWQRVLLSNYFFREDSFPSSFLYWGNSIGMTPLDTDNHHLYWTLGNYYYDTKEIAFCRNSHNRVDGLPLSGGSVSSLDNGTLGHLPEEWYWGGIGEGGSLFYNENNKRYYAIYSRNTYDSPAYQIVYRMSEPNKANVHEALSIGYGDSNADERVLLRSTEYQKRDRSNFGGSQVFSITNLATNPPTKVYYIIFHAKPRLSVYPDLQQKTFIKELRFESGDGSITPMREGTDWASSDISWFRIPINRQ